MSLDDLFWNSATRAADKLDYQYFTWNSNLDRRELNLGVFFITEGQLRKYSLYYLCILKDQHFQEKHYEGYCQKTYKYDELKNCLSVSWIL